MRQQISIHHVRPKLPSHHIIHAYFPAFGVVLRFSPELLVKAAEWPNRNAGGEWGPLEYSNWLLDQRFGQRSRPYLAHIPKVMSRVLFTEASGIWFEEFLDTSGHRFRSGRDVYSVFLVTHLVVERAREIMLWSWIVGTIGADDDTWGAEEGERAWRLLGGDESTEEIPVTLPQRATLSPERLESLFLEAGEEPPKETEYLLCECCVFLLKPLAHHLKAWMDAFPYAMLNGPPLQQWPRVSDGNLTVGQGQYALHSWANCKLVREKCFGSRKQASAVFKHVAFDDTQCGDCSTYLRSRGLSRPRTLVYSRQCSSSSEWPRRLVGFPPSPRTDIFTLWRQRSPNTDSGRGSRSLALD